MYFIYPVCSSSKGNAVYVGSRENGLLFDCGIGIRNLTNALKLQNIALPAVKAVLLRMNTVIILKVCPSWAKISLCGLWQRSHFTGANREACSLPGAKLKEIDQRDAEVCGFLVRPFRTSHDSADSMGYHVTFS